MHGLKVLAIIVATLMLVWAGRVPAASAQEPDPSAVADDSAFAPPPETEIFRLWDHRAPGASSDDAAETPTLRIVRPPEGWTNGTAVIIAPGGAYANLAVAQEGSEPAAWFAARGVTEVPARSSSVPRAAT